MKKIKKILYTIFIFSITFIIPIKNAIALTGAGEILVSKEATKLDETYGRDANVTLKVSANSFTNIDKTDVVLVMDRSTSMKGDKIKDTISATKDLLNSLLTNKTKDKVRVGIVSYNKNVNNAYTSNALTNDLDTLLALVDNTNTENGTNIHSGLLRANELLSNSNANKIIILLTDGEPYQYIGSDLKTVCENNSRDRKCKSTPTKAAVDIAEQLKKENISIYTVGFQIENDETAKKVLTDISNDPNDKYSFLASNYLSLKESFSNMIKDFTTVANNGQVTDIVPANFKVDEESLPSNVTAQLNTDNSTTLTWNIGDISSLESNELNYTIIAKENEYGSMYTNISAKLTATSIDKHPIYGSSEPISIDFDEPIVPIPTVTIDDDYTIDNTYYIKQGDKLVVNKTNGILSNDKLKNKNLDSEAIITDKIILVSDSETNGKLEDISMNELTGEFTYKSDLKTLGIVTYKYYIETTILLNDELIIVKSNTSLLKLNVIKNSTTYTVHYYEEYTKNTVSDDKIVKNVNAFDEINEFAIDIDGYEKKNETSKKLVLNSNDNVIIFYYTKRNNLSYTINYLEKNTNKVIKSSRIMNNLTYKEKIDTSKLIIDIDGYKFDSIDKDVLKISTKNNEVNIYYVRGNGIVKSVYLDNNNKNIVDTIVLEGKIDTEYETKALELTKYKLLKIDGKEKGKYIDGEIVVTYTYEKVPNTQVFKNVANGIVPITSLTIFTLLFILKKKLFN